MSSVPCNGCTLCCKRMAVRLAPGEEGYVHSPFPGEPGVLMLGHKKNGDCYYLGDTGCTIHDKAPAVCRKMDCRITAKKLTEEKARASNVIEIWRKGVSLNQEGERHEDRKEA